VPKRKLISNNVRPEARINPVDRPQYSESDVQALRAMARGQATPDQQRAGLNYIIYTVCQTYDILWRSDPSQKDLAMGQALAGQHLVWLLNTAPTTTDNAKISSRSTEQR